jgi:tRNA A-37 threonylcarbamoyl transferase component Bud32
LDGVSDPLLVAIRRSVVTSQATAEYQPPQRIGDYEVLAEIGRGGMGVVYRVRHEKLHRVVALKMLLEGEFADREERQRFLKEAQAVARLQHPNIVQIFEIGEHSVGPNLTRPYFTLELVEGGNLATRLNGRPVTSRQAAEWLEPLARAIHYAHEQGIIHRDLKPFNVLLTGDGQPKLCDFGIAKLLSGMEDKTRSGMILGTPEYMAPEQASGQAAVGPAVDIHALGALLYTMLTGRPPYQGTAVLNTLHHVQTHEPVSPRRLQPTVPRDLETICLKCLRKEPRHRYFSAAALADDLRRHLDGRPILGRRVGPVARSWKWAKRRPTLAALLTLAFFVLTVGFPVMTVLWFQANRARKAEALQRDRAETALDELESAVYAGRITLADHAHKANDVAVALDLLAQCEPKPGRPDLRGWEWYYLTRICHPDLAPDMGHGTLADAWVNAVAVRSDGRRIVSAAGLPFFGFALTGYAPGDYARIPGELSIWDAGTGKCLANLNGHQASVCTVTISPDGKWLGSGGMDGRKLDRFHFPGDQVPESNATWRPHG